MTVVALETIEVAVLVTTFCTPPMSLAMRDCTSPVRVRVKNASDMRCRCAYTDARRSCMTRWPTWFEIHVCATPITLVVIDSTIIPATSNVSSVVSRCGKASSRTPRIRNGLTTPKPADTKIRPSSAPRRRR